MLTAQRDRYEVLELLGCGATSRVEKARDTVIGRIVARKTFNNGLGEDFKTKFLREAQIIGRLSHPSIVPLFDVGIGEDGAPFLVMEYIAGQTLEQYLDPAKLSIKRACAWAADLASALAMAHQAGIIHGDVKPGNILVTAEGKVKLGDFGVARFVTQASDSGRLLGTPAYLAPEQINGEPPDPRSDQFALGIVLYQMLTGVRPFEGASVGAVCAQILNATPQPPSRYHPAISGELDRIVMRCLAKNFHERFDTCGELARALYPLARTNQLSAIAAATPRSWWSKPVRQHEIRAAISALLILASAAAATRSLHARLSVPPPPNSSLFIPGVPSEAFLSASDTFPEPQPSGDSQVPASPARLAGLPAHTRRAAKKPAIPKHAEHSSTALDAATLSAPLPLPLPPISPAIPAETLQIEIVSNIVEGTLAVYSGEKLLSTTNLDAQAPGEIIHLRIPVSAGSRPFRVALYRPDQSLRLEKEGLAEIRPGAENMLVIHVNRRAKLFLRHEMTLDVKWPGAALPVDRHSSMASATGPAPAN